MILKFVASRDQYGAPERTQYLDGFTRVQSNGIVQVDDDNIERVQHSRFTNQMDLRPIIGQRWGGDVNESFGENVYWPELPPPGPNGEGGGSTITEIYAERHDRTCVLVLACDDVFLMSDDGKTIDRLR